MCELVEKNFSFKSGSETIAATIDYCGGNFKDPAIISLHGAGPFNRNRISYLTKHLASKGNSCLRFDFSGHKDSSGEMNASSLSKRLKEALDASKYLSSDTGYVVIATSMGGHIALEMLSEIDIKVLILFCPAAYSQKAFDVPFTEAFSSIIREENSYLDANVFKKLENFRGKLVLIMGDQDAIIPDGILDMYDQYSRNTSYKKIIKIPGAPHAIHAWLDKNPEFLNIVYSEVDNVLK